MSESSEHPLWLGFLDGEELGPAEREELASLLDGDRAEELVEDFLLHGALESADRIERGAEEFASRLEAKLRSELGSIRFEQQVRQRIGRLPRKGRSARAQEVRRRRRAGGPAFGFVAVLAVAAAVVAMAVLRGGLGHRAAPDKALARVSAIARSASARRGGRLVPLEPGSALEAGDLVETPPDGAVAIAYPEGTSVELGGGGRLLLAAGTSEERRLALDAGRIVARVVRAPGRTFEVATPHAVASVTGTAFTVEVAGGATRVEVAEGAVRFTDMSTGRTIVLEAGEVASAGPGAPAPIAAPAAGEPVPAETPAAPPKRGPVGHWRLDDPPGALAADSSGRSNHGRVLGGPARVRGRLGGAFRFDGLDDRIECPVGGMPAANAPQSHTFWVRYDSSPRDARVAVGLAALPDRGVLSGFHTLAGRPAELGVWRWGGPFLVHTAMPAPGRWHHVAYTFDGTTHRLYLNGALVDSSTVAPHATVPNALTLGALPAGEERFRGELDDVRIYDRALDPDEVKELASGLP